MAANFSVPIRWYSAAVQLPSAIMRVRCMMVSQEASESRAIIRGIEKGEYFIPLT